VRRWWRSHSVRMRLTLWHAAVMVVVLSVYASVIYVYVSRSASESLNRQLSNDIWVAINTVDRDPDGTFIWMAPDETSEDEELLWVQVWNSDGTRLLFQNPEARRRPVAASAVLAARTIDRIDVAPADPFPMRLLSRRNSLYGEPIVIQVARSEAAMRRDLRGLSFILLVGLPLAVAIAAFGGYALARGSLGPIERMTERARLITAERLGERLPVDNPDDEMGRLASVFNETLARLEESFEQMRRFTADVSHELRTPLTSIRSVGEVGLRGHRDEAAYRSIIGSMLEEADRLAGFVDRLLTLSRAETHQATLSRDVVDLRRLADDTAGDLAVLAEEKRQSIVVEGAAHAETVADRLVLRQAIINLVDNAIKFTPAGGRIRIRTTETPSEVMLEVVDSGPGVPAEARAHIFDRFYRVDDGGLTRGTGLGLSIAKGAVESNGGRLTLESSAADGSTFRITLPRQIQARKRAG
jgi:heavy metal sensor kinase